MSVVGTLVEDKMYALFSFNKYPLYTHLGASAKFSINSHETDYSVIEQASERVSKATVILKYSNRVWGGQ